MDRRPTPTRPRRVLTVPDGLDPDPVRAFARHIGQRIRTARRERGVSREDLAERLQVDLSAITRYETGQRTLTAERLARIAYILDKPLGYFSEGFMFAPSPPALQAYAD